MNEIPQKLQSIVTKMLGEKRHGPELHALMDILGVSKEEVIQTFIDYNYRENQEPQSITNDIYSTKAMPLVLHIHNILPHSYHQKRQKTIIDYIRSNRPNSIVEIGYGVPQRYALEYVLSTNTMLTLADKDPFTSDFAKLLLNMRNKGWHKQIRFEEHNMDEGQYIGDYDVYLLLDSVEHAAKPTEYLTKLVSSSPSGSRFIMALPICSLESVSGIHSIAWKNERDVEKWLSECGLNIRKHTTISPDPDIDLFVRGIKGGFRNYLVEASAARP